MLKITVIKLDHDFVFEKYLQLFSLDVQKKILSYRFRIDQLRSFTSELLKYYYLAKFLNIPFSEIKIVVTDLGKPILENELNNIHFSISHSGDYVAIAVSDQLVGIDIEKIDSNISILEIGQHIFSPSENSAINGELNNFFMLWTKKESLFKALGTGFINDYYNKTKLTIDLFEKTPDYIIFSTLFYKDYYLSIAIK